jgi:hypothetical protein
MGKSGTDLTHSRMGELSCIMNYVDSNRELTEVMHTKQTLYYNQGNLLIQK